MNLEIIGWELPHTQATSRTKDESNVNRFMKMYVFLVGSDEGCWNAVNKDLGIKEI